MRILAILLLVAAAKMTIAQTGTKPPLIVSNGPFTPDGKIEIVETKLLTTTEAHKVEEGVLNSVHYRFYYTDGSGTFAGRFGNIGHSSEPHESNWDVACKKDPINDHKQCHMHLDDLWIYVRPKGKVMVLIGHNHYPGSSVSIRIDGASPITRSSTNDGDFSQQVSEKIVRQLTTAKSVTTRYMEWPYRSWVDATWEIYGFNETFKYVTWAVERIK